MRYGLLNRHLPLCRAAALVISLGAILNPSSALGGMLTTWDPGSVGILNQFGTLADVDPSLATCCPFAGFNGVPVSSDSTLLLDGRLAEAKATATVGEFSVGGVTFNNTAGTGDISALAAATTDYYIPALGSGAAVLMRLSVEGSFFSEISGSFVGIDLLVNDDRGFAVGITHDSRGSFTQLDTRFPDGTIVREELGPWTGSRDFDFFLPADPDEDTIGTLALQLWMFSNSSGGETIGNVADFLDTATLTGEPPPGGFVGLATGLAFVPDAPGTVPAPGSLALFVLGLAGLAARARRRIARR